MTPHQITLNALALLDQTIADLLDKREALAACLPASEREQQQEQENDWFDVSAIAERFNRDPSTVRKAAKWNGIGERSDTGGWRISLSRARRHFRE